MQLVSSMWLHTLKREWWPLSHTLEYVDVSACLGEQALCCWYFMRLVLHVLVQGMVDQLDNNPYSTDNKETRNWFFTLNNPDKIDADFRDPLVVRTVFEHRLGVTIDKLVYQVERGKNQNTLHLQGVFRCSTKCRSTTMSNKSRGSKYGMFIAPCISWNSSVDYCTKSDTRVSGPYFYGCDNSNVRSTNQGKRTDLNDLVGDINNGKTLKEVAMNNASTFIKYSSGIYKYYNIATTLHRDWMTTCTIYHGPTGTGKSHKAYEMAKANGGGVYYVNLPTAINTTTPMWWDGYSGEHNIIFDEFYGQVRMSEMLKLVDKYPHKVQIKGGMVEFLGRHIFITSNKNWNEWWDLGTYALHHDAFKRRITSIEHLTQPYNGNELFANESLSNPVPNAPVVIDTFDNNNADTARIDLTHDSPPNDSLSPPRRGNTLGYQSSLDTPNMMTIIDAAGQQVQRDYSFLRNEDISIVERWNADYNSQ